jgi:parvulin-like peptidyl-prolyl isomerase
MKSTFKFSALLLVAGILHANAAGAGGGADSNAPAKPVGLSDLLTDVVVAKGKGFEIKRSQLDQALVNARENLAASGRQIPPAQLPMLEQQALDSLILVQMVTLKATPEEKAKGKEESDKEFEQFKKSFPDEAAMKRQLEAVGQTLETFHASLTEQITANVILRAKAAVPEAEVQKFYEDNPSKFEHPERVRASHILLLTMNPETKEPLTEDQKKAKRKQMDDIRKRAVGGEDFAKLAKEFSEDPGSKDKGGEYIFGRGEMDPAFETAAFALKTNEVSEVVTSAYGYHIIKLSEKAPAGKTPFSEAESSIRKYLEGLAIQKMLPDYYIQLKKEAGVEILDEKLKALEDAAVARSSQDPLKDTKAGGGK